MAFPAVFGMISGIKGMTEEKTPQVQRPQNNNAMMAAMQRRVEAQQSENPMDTLMKAKQAVGMLQNQEDQKKYGQAIDQAIEAEKYNKYKKSEYTA